jgi:CheY-like chemotaxis protein
MKQGVQILVVDDEVTVRRALKMLLEHEGHEVWLVDGGEAALESLAQRKFDLIITDFSMPGMHGDELVARIRKLLPTQPIIMATAFAEEFKVFGLKELREAIERVLTQERPDQTSGLLPIIEPPSTPDFIPSRKP